MAVVREAPPRPPNIIGESPAILAVYDLIDRVARSDATALIRGESGVGKELVAHAIHHGGLRAPKPYIKVNCAALPETVIESELFGHERGAFTGALTQRKGRFELAAGGTIFLDEVGDFSPATQIKLLRVLQEKEFERVGGMDTIRADARVIAATNRDLEDLVNKGEFRQDLYYRLNVFSIPVPALRERKGDIPVLAKFFLERYSKANQKDVGSISAAAMDRLLAYGWPGNVRELENCIERAVLMTDDDIIRPEQLPSAFQEVAPDPMTLQGTLPETLESVERSLIVNALKSARGNRAKAARALGVTERTMGLRVEKYKINWRQFRRPENGNDTGM